MNILDSIVIWNMQIYELIQFLGKAINISHTSTFKNWESKRRYSSHGDLGSDGREDETSVVDVEGWIPLAHFGTYIQTTFLNQAVQQEHNRWLKEITAHPTPCILLPPGKDNVFTIEVWETVKLGQALVLSCLQQQYFTWTRSFHLFFSMFCVVFYLCFPELLLKFTACSWVTPKLFFLKKKKIALTWAVRRSPSMTLSSTSVSK